MTKKTVPCPGLSQPHNKTTESRGGKSTTGASLGRAGGGGGGGGSAVKQREAFYIPIAIKKITGMRDLQLNLGCFSLAVTTRRPSVRISPPHHTEWRRSRSRRHSRGGGGVMPSPAAAAAPSKVCHLRPRCSHALARVHRKCATARCRSRAPRSTAARHAKIVSGSAESLVATKASIIADGGVCAFRHEILAQSIAVAICESEVERCISTKIACVDVSSTSQCCL